MDARMARTGQCKTQQKLGIAATTALAAYCDTGFPARYQHAGRLKWLAMLCDLTRQCRMHQTDIGCLAFDFIGQDISRDASFTGLGCRRLQRLLCRADDVMRMPVEVRVAWLGGFSRAAVPVC